MVAQLDLATSLSFPNKLLKHDWVNTITAVAHDSCNKLLNQYPQRTCCIKVHSLTTSCKSQHLWVVVEHVRILGS